VILRIEDYGFGHITIDGRRYEKDLIILPSGEVKKRKKKLSKGGAGHTPLSRREMKAYAEEISPGKLVIGTGMYGAMPITDGALELARDIGIELVCTNTAEAVETYLDVVSRNEKTAALLHLTC
jgi:hypothetical protein